MLSISAVSFANDAGDRSSVRFEPVDYSLRGSDHIGTLKAGFVCLPSGVLRWADIRLPRDNELAEKAMAEIAKSSQTGALYPKTEFQLKARIEKFELKLCVAGLGIGERKPKGRGVINVHWTQSRWPEGSVIKSELVHSEFDVDGIDPRKDSEPLQRALVENLVKFLNSKTTH